VHKVKERKKVVLSTIYDLSNLPIVGRQHCVRRQLALMIMTLNSLWNGSIRTHAAMINRWTIPGCCDCKYQPCCDYDYETNESFYNKYRHADSHNMTSRQCSASKCDDGMLRSAVYICRRREFEQCMQSLLVSDRAWLANQARLPAKWRLQW
jgi:hypothetical protein